MIPLLTQSSRQGFATIVKLNPMVCSSLNNLTLRLIVRRAKYCTVKHNVKSNIIAGERFHLPVLAKELVDFIEPKKNQIIVDMTFGAGGHTRALIDRCGDLRVFCLDRDQLAFELANDMAKSFPQVMPLLGKFSDVHTLLSAKGIEFNSVDTVIFDVGSSSMQFDDVSRGFSLSKDGPLDMRMDRSHTHVTAADVVNYMEEAGLYKIIKKYGEERNARLIARAIVDSRYAFSAIRTTAQLASIVEAACRGSYRLDKLSRHAHVATKTFQALRIFVNDELNELNNGLEAAWRLLKPGGMCAAISFHSLEDRLVKRHFHGIDVDSKIDTSLTDRYRNSAWLHSESEMRELTARKWEPIVRKPVEASEAEVVSNPRARSAKLRAAVKLDC